jgi:hypothetical protein
VHFFCTNSHKAKNIFAVLWIRNDFFRIRSRIQIRLFREFRIRSRIRIRILLWIRILYEFVVTTFPLSLYFSLPRLSLIKSLFFRPLYCTLHCQLHIFPQIKVASRQTLYHFRITYSDKLYHILTPEDNDQHQLLLVQYKHQAFINEKLFSTCDEHE